MPSGFPTSMQFPLRSRVGSLRMFQTKNCLYLCSRSIGKPHRTGGVFGNLAFCGTVLMMHSCLEGFRDSCTFHWVEFRTCTARLTHCCFPDSSPAFPCHLRLLLLTPSEVHSVVVVACFSSQLHWLLIVCPGTNAHLWLLLFSCRGRTGDYRRPA